MDGTNHPQMVEFRLGLWFATFIPIYFQPSLAVQHFTKHGSRYPVRHTQVP